MKRIYCLLAILMIFPEVSIANGLNIGSQFWGWDSDYYGSVPGYEFYAPVSVEVDVTPSFSVYGLTELGVAAPPADLYYYPGPQPSYTDVSDITLGIKSNIFMGSVKEFVNFALDFPTGDKNLNFFQGDLPPDFVDVRYQPVTFGFSLLAGTDFPKGDLKYTIEVGYLDPGVFNESFGLPPGNTYFMENSDTFLFSASRSETFADQSSLSFGFFAFIHGPIPNFQWGPSFDFFCKLENPKGLSLDSGAQLFLPDGGGVPLVSEPFNSRGPRLYLNPSYSFGNFSLGLHLNYVFQNGYPPSSFLYDGGGWLLGIEPNFKLPVGEKSWIKFSAGYDKIIWRAAAYNIYAGRVDVLYDVFKLGVDYEIDF